MINDLLYLSSIFLATFVAGIFSFPVANVIWGKLYTKGFWVGALFGILVSAYINFLLVTLGIFTLGVTATLTSVGIWCFVNLLVAHKYDNLHILFDLRERLLLTSSVFVVLMVFWWYVRAHNPEIYQIERFMDFGFIKALRNAQTLPLYDIWMSGEVLNYYYFGHFIGYFMLLITDIPLREGFFVLVIWKFGLVGTLVFELAHTVSSWLLEKAKAVGGYATKVVPILVGLATTVYYLFLGTFHSVIYLADRFKEIFLGGEPANLWYSAATRYIDGTIAENPLYSFIVADLHPHVWGILPALLVLATILALWMRPVEIRQIDFAKKTGWLAKFPQFKSVLLSDFWYFPIFAFLLGIAFITNSWDALSLGILVVAIIATKYKMFELRKFKFEYLLFVFLPILAITFGYVWYFAFESPVTSVGIVHTQSAPHKWFAYWGGVAVIMASILAIIFKEIWEDERLNVKSQSKSIFRKLINVFWATYRKFISKKWGLVSVISAVIIAFWILLEIFYMQDILLEGEWFRANSYFKLTTQIWVWSTIILAYALTFALTNFRKVKIPLILSLFAVFGIGFVYTPFALNQSNLSSENTGTLSGGLDWLKDKYPNDYQGVVFLDNYRAQLPENDRIRTILEAEGDSYQDNNYFSVYLGWPSVVGWPVHEWTWRGTYDEVGLRRGEVREIYETTDQVRRIELLAKYDVDFVIIGHQENDKYEVQTSAIGLLGSVLYENPGITIIEIDKSEF